MSKLSRRLILAAAALAALAAIAWWMIHIPAVQDAIFRRVIARTLAETRNDLLAPDALRVVLCGTGNPLADRERAAACTAIFAGGNIYLVDIGPGAWKNLALWHIPAPRIAAVMFTHFHSDHIGDLGELNIETWANGRDHPLRVYGPVGVDQVVNGFAQAYSLDEGYRIAHHGIALMSPANWQMQPLAVKIDTPAGTSPCAGGSCDGARGERTQGHRIHRRSLAGRARLRLSIRLQGSLGRSQRRYQTVRQPGRGLQRR